ncbi:MAG: hypothetical protein MI755_16400 [Sphingomonadales bacterium]|nr:hypothetical protein [Sphingomonadales bacterium]
MPQIKINRAAQHSETGRYPETFRAMLGHVPADLIARVTGRDLAMIIDALARCATRSKAIAERDACDEGVIWDARKRTLREIRLSTSST